MWRNVALTRNSYNKASNTMETGQEKPTNCVIKAANVLANFLAGKL